MGTRARGANAVSALAFETLYGVPPASGFFKMPFVSSALGETQGLQEDDLLGLGREPLKPDDGTVDNDGDNVVPVDVRYFGLWLKLLLGTPTTTQGLAAKGEAVFSDQPANNATLTLNGKTITFVTGTPTADQVKIGATLGETLQNLVWMLNAHADALLTVASYSTDLKFTKLLISHDTIGTSGNTFALAKSTSPASNVTLSASTLAGGSTSGPYNHVFTSGALTLPSASFEIGNPEVPSYGMNYGLNGNTLAISLSRSGMLNATIGLIGQGESIAKTSQAGTPTEMVVDRFSQFAGQINYKGVPLGNIVSGSVNLSNNLDKAENIRGDGRIDGADPGKFSVTPEVVSRFADTLLLDAATNKESVELAYGWVKGPHSLTFKMTQVRLPRPKRSITGPAGVQVTYGGQGHKDAVSGKSLIVTLVNDVASYA